MPFSHLAQNGTAVSLEFALLDASSDDVHAVQNFERELPVPVTKFDVANEDRSSDGGTDFDAIVISGSWASVYWDLDWMSPLKDQVAAVVDREIPILGVCFGFHLLADVLGGNVEGQDVYELGFHTIEHADYTRLFEGIDREFLAFTSHSDDVVAVPLGARRLAENEYSAHAFRWNHAFGVQFHPEIDWKTAQHLTEERDPSQERCPDAMETSTDANYQIAKETTRIFENFTEYVREHHST